MQRVSKHSLPEVDQKKLLLSCFLPLTSYPPKPQSTIRIWSLCSYKYILRVTSSSPPSDKNLTVSGCISSVFCICAVAMYCSGRLDTHSVVVGAYQTGGSTASNGFQTRLERASPR